MVQGMAAAIETRTGLCDGRELEPRSLFCRRPPRYFHPSAPALVSTGTVWLQGQHAPGHTGVGRIGARSRRTDTTLRLATRPRASKFARRAASAASLGKATGWRAGGGEAEVKEPGEALEAASTRPSVVLQVASPARIEAERVSQRLSFRRPWSCRRREATARDRR